MEDLSAMLHVEGTITEEQAADVKAALSGTPAIVRAGDTLIVGWPQPTISREQADHVCAYVKERLPGVQVVVVPATQFAVYRPDGA